MSLKTKIEEAFKEALKTKQKDAVSALRMLKSALKNAEIEKKGELSDSEITALIRKLIKQRQESIEAFEKGGRSDLVEKEKAELEVLKQFLPPELSDSELEEIIKNAIEETGATGPRDMGKVMKVVMAKVQGRADGKKVSQMVKEKLGGAR